MSSYNKFVKLACKPNNPPPRSKYIESTIAATWSEDVAVSDACKALAPHFRESNSVVVFERLIVLHTMIRQGATGNVLAHITQSDALKLRNVESAIWGGFQNHLHHYAQYLDCRIRAYQDLKQDIIQVQSESNQDKRNSFALDEEKLGYKKGKRGNSDSANTSLSRGKMVMGGKLRSMTVEKGLLRETKVIHQMIDAVVECKFYLDRVDDELRLEALQMLVRDLLILFQAGNDAVLNLLERYFEMSRTDAAEALSIYRLFCEQTEHVTEYLGVAKKLQKYLNVPIPNLRHAPLSLVATLRGYLNDSNFEQNRKDYEDYKANRVAADGKDTLRPLANNTKTASSPKPDTKSTTLTSGAAQPTTSATPSPRDQEKRPISVGDFLNSIEENQVKMFDPPGSSPSTQTAPNPFAPMISGQPFAIPQITIQSTESLMPQHTAVPDATNPFRVTGQQQPSSTAGQPLLTAPDQQNLLRPPPTGPNLFCQSMLAPQSTGRALFGVGNSPGMGLGSPQQQPNTNTSPASTQPTRPMDTSSGQSLSNTATPQRPHPQSQQTQPSASSATQVGLSNSALAKTAQTQSNINTPQQPASTTRSTSGSAATSSSPPPTLPLKPRMIGPKNPFAPFMITPAPPLPKPFTKGEIAIGFGGAGSAPFGLTPPQKPSHQQRSGQSTKYPTGGLNSADSALNPGGTDIGSTAGSFAFANAKSHCGTATSTPPTGSTRTRSTFSSSSLGGSPSLASQSATRIGTSTSTSTDPASAKLQKTGFVALKPSKRKKRTISSSGTALMKSLPLPPNQSGPTSPPSTAGSSASAIRPPVVCQLDRDAAFAVELQQQFEAEDQQLRAQRQALQRLSLVVFRCCICMEDQPEDSGVARIEKCRHEFCRECLRDYTTSKISERCFPIVCPICATEKGRPDPGLVDETIIQQLGISNKHYQIFVELQIISFSVPVHCRRCKQTMFIDREEFQATKEITCPLPGCQYVWCKACQQPIKADGPKHSCDGANELQHLIQQQGWKICPGCQTPVQKIDGCNHITCITPGCNSHFCYVDGAMILKGGTQDQVESAKMKHYRKCKLFDYV